MFNIVNFKFTLVLCSKCSAQNDYAKGDTEESKNHVGIEHKKDVKLSVRIAITDRQNLRAIVKNKMKKKWRSNCFFFFENE